LSRRAPLKTVSAILEKEGIIRNKHLFVAFTTLLGKKMEIKAGEYELHTAMRPYQVLNALVKGQVIEHLVTIPEGFTLAQIAQQLEDSNILEKAFFRATSRPSSPLSTSVPACVPRLKVSFPDTYHFTRRWTPKK
jgi:UPF0755 protein